MSTGNCSKCSLKRSRVAVSSVRSSQADCLTITVDAPHHTKFDFAKPLPNHYANPNREP